ncbi:hypothetical protein LCL89_00735 [Halobacillus yeomjeoni]|uniref:Uncharacterized protein n=1 Tax=Halobacillus yeomjeoni TaxID=311194 RepID=A0A931HUK8_9BACI|nr:hypothetical protein [Halobacillus yeomjeoni]MBH0230057.1 hypothetical protein [Halobacillus yeomjeoni]MCA0982566.1 hypothetical protein [Halobacillus yeomjeoni]
MVFFYLLVGFIWIMFKKEPSLETKEEQAVYMFYMLGLLIFWPIVLLVKIFLKLSSKDN